MFPSSLSTLRLSLTAGILHVELSNGPLNLMRRQMWTDLSTLFDQVSANASAVSVIVISGDGKSFSAGLDLADHRHLFTRDDTSGDVARQSLRRRRLIRQYQSAVTALEKCVHPVIACLHGFVIGGAVDLVTAADIRLVCADVQLSIAEVAVGLCADVGTLARIGSVVGSASSAREWALTGRNVGADECVSTGLCSGKVHEDKAALIAAAMQLAQTIASNSPVAVAGTKHNIVFARDHSVADALEYVATWNAAMIDTADITMNINKKRNSKNVYARL